LDPVSDFDWDAWNSDGQAVRIGVEIVPKIIEENGRAVAREICVTKSKGKASPDEQLYRELKKRRNSS
jgi:hypothetical protein